MSKPKLAFLIIFSLVGILIATSLGIFLSKRASKSVEMGDFLFSLGEVTQALESYEQAQRTWPLLKFNPEFNFKTKQARETLESVEKGPNIQIFMKDTAMDFEIESLVQEIKIIKGIREVECVSKEEYVKRYKEMNPEISELKLTSIVPVHIQVYLADFNNTSLKDKIVQLAQDRPFVDEIITHVVK